MSDVWSDEVVERLRLLVSKRMTASEIALLLGNGISRNAVIGKMIRLGIKSQNLPNGKGVHRSACPRERWASIPLEQPMNNAMTPINPVHILDRTDQQCKFPVWRHDEAPTFLYCGKERVPGRSYCCHHLAICCPQTAKTA